MAKFTTTTHATFIPEIWSKEAQIARESKLLMANRVERYDVDFANGGDLLHIPKVSTLSASDISTSDGTISDSTPTEGEATITIDKWKGCSVDILDLVTAQAKLDLMKLYSEKLGYALALSVDTDLLALYTGLSTNVVGTYNTELTDAVIRSAVQKLDEADAPFEDRFCAVKPSAKYTMLGIDKFVRYDAMGPAGGGTNIQKGDIGELYGVTFMSSNNVVKSTNDTHNLMWQKSAFGLAMVKDVRIEKMARTAFSDRLAASELYGVAELRDDHAVQVKS